ncbi:hypothetical protein F5Y03DRAFT_387098 [Xylaria venustula]|nr:hypothetical protein F5Y03DRAFT_387098 [Xylaria venustula]
MEKRNDKGHERVLLTGGSGFIASHVLDTLLDAGFQVVVTARSEGKGRTIVESVKPRELSFAVVEDVAKEGAFDHVFQTNVPFDYVVHTASPYHLNVQDPVKDFLDPAIKGTTGVLKSIKAHGPTVKRFVLTSSSAAVLNPDNHPKVYDETCWAPTTLEDAINQPAKHGYRASKVLSEKAAWAFVDNEKPNFDLAVINCTFVFGPIQRKLASLEAMNTSNHRIRDMMQGKMKDGLVPTAPVFTWVDVRDVALAHLQAMTVPKAGGNRFYVVGGHFSNKQIADIIREKFPSLADRLPADAVNDLPDDVYGFNNGKSREFLGIEYTSLEKSIPAILLRQVITQTITNDGYITTAVVTLGSSDPSSAPSAPSSGSPGSNSVSPTDIGIIIGSLVGALIVGLAIWLCCITNRREEDYEYQDEGQMAAYDDAIQPPSRSYWPRFPKSIPPPAVPTYTAIPIQRSYPGSYPRTSYPRTYTANRAGRRIYGFYDDQQ